jgi:hypothetical protein
VKSIAQLVHWFAALRCTAVRPSGNCRAQITASSASFTGSGMFRVSPGCVTAADAGWPVSVTASNGRQTATFEAKQAIVFISRLLQLLKAPANRFLSNRNRWLRHDGGPCRAPSR